VNEVIFVHLPDVLSIVGVLIISDSDLAVAYLQHHQVRLKV